MKHLVIHQNCIEQDLKYLELDSNMRKARLDALWAIGELKLREEEGEKVVRFSGMELENVGDFFNKGDEVILYGAYLGACLKKAMDSLQKRGIKGIYHPKGCIGLDFLN